MAKLTKRVVDAVEVLECSAWTHDARREAVRTESGSDQ